MPVKRSTCLPASLCLWHPFLGRYETAPHNLRPKWQELKLPQELQLQACKSDWWLWLSLWSCSLCLFCEDRLQANLCMFSVLPQQRLLPRKTFKKSSIVNFYDLFRNEQSGYSQTPKRILKQSYSLEVLCTLNFAPKLENALRPFRLF